ncbi:hypothetical protein CZ774_15555 [Frigoribacterium sp. JB110]|nr:hypothetical protein CZ774_15555 [Frigoribacterium sp. JB110]
MVAISLIRMSTRSDHPESRWSCAAPLPGFEFVTIAPSVSAS